jgi:transcriptional regulator with XRE-family HTH domain
VRSDRRLVELRLGAGLSQEARAVRAAVSVRAISDLERGSGWPILGHC